MACVREFVPVVVATLGVMAEVAAAVVVTAAGGEKNMG